VVYKSTLLTTATDGGVRSTGTYYATLTLVSSLVLRYYCTRTVLYGMRWWDSLVEVEITQTKMIGSILEETKQLPKGNRFAIDIEKIHSK
jgi:hypothetical protein